MKYWRKMLLAVFALCLCAGMAVGAELAPQSICDPDCKDGMLFIGDMFYDGILCEAVYPEQDCPCENLNWPLDGAVWGCDFGFLNTGTCKIPTQQWCLKGFTPHKTVWSESEKILFVSYLNTVHPQGQWGSPLITALDLDAESMFNIQPYDFDDLNQHGMQAGALALDDDRHLLYVANMNPWDATVVVLDVSDPCCPTKPLCDPEIDLCALCGCADPEHCCDCVFRNMDMVFYKDKLYVSYFDTTAENGIGYGDPRIAVFNADPDSVNYGEQVDCIKVVLDCPCIDENDSYFLASNLAVSEKANGDVIVFATYHPGFCCGDMAAIHALGIFEWDYEDYVNRPLGVITATNMTTRESVFTDLNSAAFREKLKNAGICMDGHVRLNLRAIDVNSCGCGDCEDMVIYVTAMKYLFGTDCNGKIDFGLCPFDYEFNYEEAVVPYQGYVLGLTYNSNDCEVGNEIEFKDFKVLPKKDLGWCGWDVEWPWSPGDIVATSWVKENNVVVEAPVDNGDGTFTVKTTYLNIGEAKDALGFEFHWDPAVLQFTSHKITKEGSAEVFATLPSDQTAGAFGWDDILAEFQSGLGNKETLTLEMTVTPLAADDATVCFAGDGEVSGYECFAVTTPAPPTPPCPCPCDNAELLEEDEDGYPTDFGDYSGEFWVFQVVCDPDVPASVAFAFDEANGGEYELVEWNGSGWSAVTADLTWNDPDDDELTVAAGFACDGVYAMVQEGGLEALNDGGAGGGGGETPVSDSSSGCNVGFSAAALLFAVPLVSIFRKR